MNNTEIIANAAIAAGIYTEQQVKDCFEKGFPLPLHTFAEWKNLGYIVKKGEKAKLACKIWNYAKKTDTATDKDNLFHSS